MQHLLLLCAAILGARHAAALLETDVGVVDWHKPLVGLPNTHAPWTLPLFHRVRNHSDDTTSSHIIVGTKSNVLAALIPDTGEIAWRHQYPLTDPLLSFQPHLNADRVAAQSGPGGSTVRVYSSTQGLLVCDAQLHPPNQGRLQEPAWLGSALAFDSASKDLHVLTNGNTVSKLGVDCKPLWKWESPAESHSVIFTQLLATENALYVAGLTASVSSYTLHIVSLSPKDGTLLSDRAISSSIKSPTDFLLLSSKTPSEKSHSLIWIQDSKIKHIPLDPTLSKAGSKPSKVDGTFKSVHTFGRHFNGLFTAKKQDGSANILRLLDDGHVKNAWEFGTNSDPYSASPSIYCGGYDKEGNAYVARLYWSFSLSLASMEIFSDGIDGRGMITGFSFPFDPFNFGIIQHVTLDVSAPDPLRIQNRFVISTTMGSYQLWHRENLQWNRDEGLSEIVENGVQFVDLPERQKDIDYAHESFFGRLARQAVDAKNFPAYIQSFIARLTGSSSHTAVLSTNTTGLYRDAFGFRKLILAVGSNGKIYALDSTNGGIVYTKTMSFGGVHEASWKILKLFVMKKVGNNGPDEQPVAALVASRISKHSTPATLVFTWEALTGKAVKIKGDIEAILDGEVGFELEAESAHLVEVKGHTTILIVDDDKKVHFYPDHSTTITALGSDYTKFNLPLIDSKSRNLRLTGHKIVKDGGASSPSLSLIQTWTHSLPPGHVVQKIFKPPSHQPLASYGKVLGNRTTLYKYLNANLVGIVSSVPASSGTRSEVAGSKCAIYLVDGGSGKVVYQASIPVAKGPSTTAECDVQATFTENWLVYHYWNSDISKVGQTKGWRVVSVEIYEGSGVDQRLKSSERSSYSLDSVPVRIFEKSWVFHKPISAITTTTTANGISVKDVIVATSNGAIHSISRRLLDPRRPKTKPSSAEVEEEWLIQYDPVIPDDPKRVLSHKYDVKSITNLYTSPTLLESTSLLFAHGLDLFLTRVSPSGTFDLLSETFNKTQLIFTILGLSIAILITRPMVRRKALREKWYF